MFKRTIKVIVVIAILALLLSGCASGPKIDTNAAASRYKTIEGGIVHKPIVADLEIMSQERIVGTYNMSSDDNKKPNKKPFINLAIQNAIKQVGADLLVDPYVEIVDEGGRLVISRSGLGSSRKYSIRVTGYPAKYRNLRPISEEDYEWVDRLPHIGRTVSPIDLDFSGVDPNTKAIVPFGW